MQVVMDNFDERFMIIPFSMHQSFLVQIMIQVMKKPLSVC